MDINFWNTRYKEAEYAYGTEPNDFLKSKIHVFKPDSKILCLAEGEGRNAVFLASQGHRITAVDYSQEGLNKLQKLALNKKLSIETLCVDLTHYKIEEHAWDGIICIFGHFPESLRKAVFGQVYKGLNKGGVFLMEAYHKDQLKYKTGGPQVVELLYSKEELQEDFSAFTAITIETCDKDIEEGKYHKGTSAVIQVVAKKSSN
ncbi:MAG: class I SAM-dependent methyltransferase [Bacteroidia bacterium]|nr:class I SAM-dependent methyltransferase [Bacteroidia bacterium]